MRVGKGVVIERVRPSRPAGGSGVGLDRPSSGRPGFLRLAARSVLCGVASANSRSTGIGVAAKRIR